MDAGTKQDERNDVAEATGNGGGEKSPDELAAEAVARNRERRQREEEEGPLTGQDAVKKLAEGESVTDEAKVSALDWFLTDDEEDELLRTFEINVGSPETPRWIAWTIRAVDLDTLRRIRQRAMGSRAARRSGTGEMDEVAANLRIVIEGTVEPNLADVARQKQIPDPAIVLQHRFRHKPGLLGQIAGEIMSLSGYDEEDVRDVAAGKG